MIVQVTFENDNGRYLVYMKQEDAVDMIRNTPMFSCESYDAKNDESFVIAENIFRELKIKP